MGWFEDLFGAEENTDYDTTQRLFREDGDELVAPNGRRFKPGEFETPSLEELKRRVDALDGAPPSPLVVEHVFADVFCSVGILASFSRRTEKGPTASVAHRCGSSTRVRRPPAPCSRWRPLAEWNASNEWSWLSAPFQKSTPAVQLC